MLESIAVGEKTMRMLTLVLISVMSSSAIAEWKGVASNKEGLFWFLELDQGRLLMVEHVYAQPEKTIVNECWSRPLGGGQRYDIVQGTGAQGEVLITDTTGGRFLACRWQGNISQNPTTASVCMCGVMTTLSATPPATSGPPRPPVFPNQ